MKSGINLTPKSRAETSWVKFTSTSGTWFQAILASFDCACFSYHRIGRVWQDAETWVHLTHFAFTPDICNFSSRKHNFCLNAGVLAKYGSCAKSKVGVTREIFALPQGLNLWSLYSTPHPLITTKYHPGDWWWTNGHQTGWVMLWALFYPYPLKKKLRLFYTLESNTPAPSSW